MAKLDKLKARFLLRPSDFSWDELTKLLTSLGYCEFQTGKTSGSRARFIHTKYPPIALHKPHPKSILKRYQLNQLLAALKERGQL